MLALISIFVLCVNLVESSGGAGKVAFWSLGISDASKAKNDYQTKAVENSHVNRFLEENSGKYDKIVLLKSQDSSSVLSVKDVNDVFEASPTKTVMSSVYNSNRDQIADQILSSETFRNHKKVSIDDELKKELTTPRESPNKVGTNTYEVTLGTGQDAKAFFADMQERGIAILWIAVEEPTLVSKSSRQLTATPAHYSRILASTSNNVYYEPEGTEFSIYYADTYLYITPDIFTGLMTGLFIFFVLLIGLTCISNIQGTNHFVDKLPPVGREA